MPATRERTASEEALRLPGIRQPVDHAVDSSPPELLTGMTECQDQRVRDRPLRFRSGDGWLPQVRSLRHCASNELPRHAGKVLRTEQARGLAGEEKEGVGPQIAKVLRQ